MDLDKKQLTQLLREAEKAHAAYEKQTGETDPDWPSCYAQYMIDKINKK